MKTLPALVAGLTLAIAMPIVAPAFAQAAPAAPAAPAATTAKHYTTGDTAIGTLIADPAAKAIVDKHIPGFSANPQISMVSSATLLQIQPMKPEKLSDQVLAAIDADLAKIPVK